jgi:hypothetical protein
MAGAVIGAVAGMLAGAAGFTVLGLTAGYYVASWSSYRIII